VHRIGFGGCFGSTGDPSIATQRCVFERFAESRGEEEQTKTIMESLDTSVTSTVRAYPGVVLYNPEFTSIVVICFPLKIGAFPVLVL
jgi:hypothetical protein